MQFKTKALFQRYFGTNHQYYDYRYSKMHPEPGFWGTLSILVDNIKKFPKNHGHRKNHDL
jgi:hypothetical protein